MFRTSLQILVFWSPGQQIMSLITFSGAAFNVRHKILQSKQFLLPQAGCLLLSRQHVSVCSPPKAEMSKWIQVFITVGRCTRELQNHFNYIIALSVPLGWPASLAALKPHENLQLWLRACVHHTAGQGTEIWASQHGVLKALAHRRGLSASGTWGSVTIKLPRLLAESTRALPHTVWSRIFNCWCNRGTQLFFLGTGRGQTYHSHMPQLCWKIAKNSEANINLY